MNNTASGSKDFCPRFTEEKDKHSKNKEVTFIILQKTWGQCTQVKKSKNW